jgi:hypothetical protein
MYTDWKQQKCDPTGFNSMTMGEKPGMQRCEGACTLHYTYSSFLIAVHGGYI